MENKNKVGVDIGPGFWNFRCSFKVKGLIDIGSHMSIIRLSSGKFLVIDTIPLTDQVKAEIDQLTDSGKNIEAVVGVHPFHTIYFPAFHKAYPNVPFYGCPRHLRKLTDVKWEGDLNDCKVRSKWEPDVFMRVPAGAEFVSPQPEASNHFCSVLVFHPASRTLHVDDTIIYTSNPGFLLRLGGFKANGMCFHNALKTTALHPTPEAPLKFEEFMRGILNDWDFDNICSAHNSYKIGGVKKQLEELFEKTIPSLHQQSAKNEKIVNDNKDPTNLPSVEDNFNVSGCECG